MKQYNLREFQKLLTDNGFVLTSCHGDHYKYKRDGISLVINKKPNRMVMRRLIKEHNLT